jgi:CRP-like cAMP-binding protein
LPPDTLARLLAELMPVRLTAKRVLFEPGQPITTVYFPLTAVVSVLTLVQGKPVAGAALVGREGIAELPRFSGIELGIAQATVQVAGTALSMPASTFQAMVATDSVLQAVLGRYIEVRVAQLVQAAGCNLRHPIAQRCAQWLLHLHDRVQTDTVTLTHASLGLLLGVRRESVTVTVGALQQAGLIHYQRGRVSVVDRTGLEATACECYRVIADLTNRLLPPPQPN